jgi:thioredoxin reductase
MLNLHRTMITGQEPIYDAVIVGGGPAGLSAALLLGRSRRRVIVIDENHPRNEVARELHGFLTRDGIAPAELRKAGRADLSKYGCDVRQDVVARAECVADETGSRFSTAFRVITAAGKSFVCRKLLFATGMRDEPPDFPGVRECYGATIHHCPYCDGWEHRDRRLLAYGEDAVKGVELGLALRGWSPHVTVLTHGTILSEEDQRRLETNRVAWAAERIVRFQHEGSRLLGVECELRETLPADALFFSAPQRSKCELAGSLGVTCDDEFAGRTSDKQQTNVPGIFIAGDADGDVQFAIVAAAEGAKAAVAMNAELLQEDQL